MWGFDESRRQPGLNVPFDVAVKECDARVIGLESKDCVAEPVNEERVPAHGDFGRWCRGYGVWCTAVVSGRAGDHLELMGVEVEGVGSIIIVNYCQLYDRVVRDDDGIGVGAVYFGIVDILGWCAQRSVESGDLLR